MSRTCGRVACLLSLLSLSVGAAVAQSPEGAPSRSPAGESQPVADPALDVAADEAAAESEPPRADATEEDPSEPAEDAEASAANAVTEDTSVASDSADEAQPPPSTPDVGPERATLPLVVQQRRVLGRELQALDREIDDSSTLLPWSILTLGIASVVTGAVVGAAQAFDCRRSCGASGWTGWAVIGGGAVGLGGLIWLRLADDEIESLESRRYHLTQRLQHLDWDNP